MEDLYNYIFVLQAANGCDYPVGQRHVFQSLLALDFPRQVNMPGRYRDLVNLVVFQCHKYYKIHVSCLCIQKWTNYPLLEKGEPLVICG